MAPATDQPTEEREPLEREVGHAATDQPTDAQGEPLEREIGHDEFDPVGTLALIMIYFLIIAGLWVFMYFIEFLGNGPTVV